jgi:hypothetical protein
MFQDHHFFQNLAEYTRAVQKPIEYNPAPNVVLDVGSDTIKMGRGGTEQVQYIIIFFLNRFISSDSLM